MPNNLFLDEEFEKCDDLSVDQVYKMNNLDFYNKKNDYFYERKDTEDFVPEFGNEKNIFSGEFEISDDNSSDQINNRELKTETDDIKTPTKHRFLRKGEGKSLVISNSRKESSKNGKNFKPDFIKRVDSFKKSTRKANFSPIKSDSEEKLIESTFNNNDFTEYDKLIQQKLHLLDEKMEYIHQTHEEIIRNKTILNRERKQLESYKISLEKEFKSKYEKSKIEFETEKKKLENENIRLTKEKIKFNELITHLKMTIKSKDAEINRLIKDISKKEKKEKELEDQLNKSRNNRNNNLRQIREKKTVEKNSKIKNEPEYINSASNSNITPITTILQTTSMSSNSSSSFIDRDAIIEDFLSNFDFEKELDLLYGILSTSFSFSEECDDFTTLPKIPNDLDIPWCDIEKPYKVIKDEDLKTITFKFPSGLVEIVFIDENTNSICPLNTRKLMWTHLGWCVLVYPNNDIKAIKPDKDIVYHYVEKDIVKCVVNVKNILTYDGEETKLHLSKFFSLKQLQCVDPETKKTYIIHSDKSKQILNDLVS